jgi:DNA-directed RNA polymerase specialized sigma24 family protein
MAAGDQESLQELLRRLKAGDVVAAEKIFVAFEPYLRQLVRRKLSVKLRTKFDSIDVVQSVWGDLVKGFQAAQWGFNDVEMLRSFLIKTTLHRLIDNVRRHQGALTNEQPMVAESQIEDPLAPQGGPGGDIMAEETWKQLLFLCPSQHRELLLLKRQGYTIPEIAFRSGLHEGSVRRVFHDLARRYALHQKDRR